MSSDEKKFKISELPDEGSSFISTPPKKTPPKKEKDPRLEKLQLLSEREKVLVMTQTWKFDRSVWKFTWVPYILILVAAQSLEPYQQYVAEMALLDANSMELGGAVVGAFTKYLEFLIKNPLILAVLTPLFFKFKGISDYHFEITFDGIRTVREVLSHGSKKAAARTFIKWEDIVRVEKRKVAHRDTLVLSSGEGQSAEMIWDIDLRKKKAIKLILNGLINNKHPLRAFLENEKELQ